MAQFEITAVKTYATAANAIKAVEKKGFADERFFIMRDASGRHFPVFVGSDRLIQRGVHWHFNCVG